MQISSDFRRILEQGMERLAWGAEGIGKRLPPVEAGKYLDLNYNTGSYVVQERRGFWAGYLAGKLWFMYDVFGSDSYREAATLVTRWCAPMARDTGVDVGFVAQYAPVLGYELTGEEWMKELALKGCASFIKNYNPELDIFMLWPPTEPLLTHRATSPPEHFKKNHRELFGWETFIDVSACASVLWWARRFEPRYGDMAKSHQEGMSRSHQEGMSRGLIQPNGKVYHLLGLDPKTKKPIKFHTNQGFNDTTHWTRAQGWAMNSSVAAYEATGEQQFLDSALLVCDYYLNEMIKGGDPVPFYDVLDPRIPNVPRDTCTAALACNCMVRLIQEQPDLESRYGPYVEETITELFNNHVTPGGILLHGSWGYGRGRSVECVMPYGNMYFPETIYRLLKPGRDILGIKPKAGVGG